MSYRLVESMHRVLLITDILLQVFEHFSQLESRNMLAVLARTCRAFHETAMHFLWSEIDGLRPLLGCVTRLHPIMNSDKDHQQDLYWIQSMEPLSAQEACQFLRHAARVRALHVTYDDDALFHFLTVLPIEICVFPRLLSLRWRSPSSQNIRYLRLFLSPTLHCCDLLDYSAHYSDLKFLATSCPVLEFLSIKPLSGVVHEYSMLSTIVCSCERLVGLCCPPLDSAAWKHLSNLPTLDTVIITNALPDVHYPFDRENLDFAPFLSVTILCFRLEGAVPSVAKDIITVIQHSEFPSLTSFQFQGAPPWEDIERLLRALSQCKAHTLEDIEITCVESDRDDDFLPVIGHFLCFGQLRTLDIYVGTNIYLDNDLLLQAMSSWPYLESLKLEDDGYDFVPSVTLRGLVAALRVCPRLHTLRISVDTFNIDMDPDVESFQHTSLRTLTFGPWGMSHTTDAEALARIIFSMLPRVCKVNRHGEEWDEVNQHLELLASVRAVQEP